MSEYDCDMAMAGDRLAGTLIALALIISWPALQGAS
jgi:hypothetical protein